MFLEANSQESTVVCFQLLIYAKMSKPYVVIPPPTQSFWTIMNCWFEGYIQFEIIIIIIIIIITIIINAQ